MKYLKLKVLVLIALCFITTSCESTKTALFDQYSYQKTTELKVEAITLMSKATTAYSLHKEEVDSLLLDIKKLMEYEKNKPNNEITFEMWLVLNDKEKSFLAGFFKLWETKGSVSPVFQKEAKIQVSEALDLLIQYEIKKDKESKKSLLDLINLNN